jgi:hypothetical protein
VVSAFWVFLTTVLLSESIFPPHASDQGEYIRYAKNFPEMLLTGQFATNGAARWGPSALCWLISQLFFISLTDMNIMRIFQTLVIVWGTVGAFFWTRIADILGVRDKGKWLGLILLYVNFGAIKFDVYMPVMTDASAFLIALAQLYFYLSKRPLALIGVTLFGAFTFPGLEVTGLLLYVLPADPLQPLPQSLVAQGARGWIVSCSNLLIAGALALATAVLIYIALPPLAIITRFQEPAYLRIFSNHIFSDLIPLSIAMAALYVFLATGQLLRCDWWTPLRRLKYRRAVVGILVLSGIWVVRLAIARGHSDAYLQLGFEPNPYLEEPMHIFRRAGAFPLSFALASLLWFGLGMLFIYSYWKVATKIMQRYGLPIVVIVGMATFLHFDTSPRHMTQIYPIAIAFTVAAADRTLNRWSALIPVALLAVLQSRVWASINPAGGLSGAAWTDEQLAHFISVMAPYWPQSTVAAAMVPIGLIVSGIALVHVWRLSAARKYPDRAADTGSQQDLRPATLPAQTERSHS